MHVPRRLARMLVVACAAAATFAPAAQADPKDDAPALTWKACGDAPNVECATFTVPRDYDRPHGATLDLHVARSHATEARIGTLFFNFGGPGGSAADSVEAAGADLFPALGKRFDIVGVDPRGVGQSSPSIDCKANQETEGIYSKPFATPDNLDVGALMSKDSKYIARCLSLNRDLLPFVSTANVARDFDALRAALGEKQLNYLGFSYGTFLGATYASLFPNRYRAMVLDGPVDATAYINDPTRNLSAQTSGFERSLGRFLAACARDQAACRGFGGEDPWDAYDALLDKLAVAPLTVGDRQVDKDDAIGATAVVLYNKQNWPFLAQALADAQAGDGGLLRLLADFFWGRNPDGTYDPITDRYFTIGAIEQNYSRDLRSYIRLGQQSWDQHDHFWFNNGYVELNYGLFPIDGRDVFAGPFRVPDSAVTPLVVATTQDPATPYRGALNLVRDLHNARLLTMRGDNHTAYSGNSSCVDKAVDAYLLDVTLPDPGTQCPQDLVSFSAPQVTARTLTSARSVQALRTHIRQHIG